MAFARYIIFLCICHGFCGHFGPPLCGHHGYGSWAFEISNKKMAHDRFSRLALLICCVTALAWWPYRVVPLLEHSLRPWVPRVHGEFGLSSSHPRHVSNDPWDPHRRFHH
jgi:hypothetical protein